MIIGGWRFETRRVIMKSLRRFLGQNTDRIPVSYTHLLRIHLFTEFKNSSHFLDRLHSNLIIVLYTILKHVSAEYLFFILSKESLLN